MGELELLYYIYIVLLVFLRGIDRIEQNLGDRIGAIRAQVEAQNDLYSRSNSDLYFIHKSTV